jgi:hypothetical protein
LEESSLALWSFLEPASSGYQVQKLPCTDVHSLKVKVVNFKYKQLKIRSCRLFLQLVQWRHQRSRHPGPEACPSQGLWVPIRGIGTSMTPSHAMNFHKGNAPLGRLLKQVFESFQGVKPCPQEEALTDSELPLVWSVNGL